jgi:hypothetical protein
MSIDRWNLTKSSYQSFQCLTFTSLGQGERGLPSNSRVGTSQQLKQTVDSGLIPCLSQEGELFLNA